MLYVHKFSDSQQNVEKNSFKNYYFIYSFVHSVHSDCRKHFATAWLGVGALEHSYLEIDYSKKWSG